MKHADTIEYLEAAIEMEVGILKLEETSRGIKEEAAGRRRERERYEKNRKDERDRELKLYTTELDDQIKDLENATNRVHWDVECAEEEYEKKYAAKKNKKKEKRSFNIVDYFTSYGKGVGICGIFLGAFLACVLIEMAIFGRKLTEDETLATYAGIIAIAVGFVSSIAFFVGRILRKKKNGISLKARISDLKNESKKAQNSFLKAKKNREKKLAEFRAKQDEEFKIACLPQINGMKKQEKFLLSQADQTDLVLEKLYQQRNTFYSVGIVPPDYRYLDCVGVLHQIFVNDLADTMRDAVLLYEERVFRGDLIRGVDKINVQLRAINHNLQEINVMMRFVCEKLAEISAQSGMMVAELGNIADKIDENTAVSEMILGGIALQNAQAEAIKNNTKSLLKYS